MSLELGMIVAHVPRICHEDKVADFQKPLTEAMHKVSDILFSVKPDVAISISTHFVATFHHYVNATPRHKGILTAVECPDLISDVAYDYPGDLDLANQMVEAGKKEGLPIVGVNDPTYIWDYGTLVPFRYLVPKENLPIIDLSICQAASLDETYQWGEVVGKVLRKSNKRAVFISSGALAHNLVRGPDKMPTKSEQALDNQFIEYVMNGDYNSAREMLPQYSKIAGVEAGGRHLAMLLGVLGEEFKAQYHGYAQSSGSGNAVMTFHHS
jgi:3,4-dihydroxyphenylacetate 2,3-dioxygenase